MKEPTKKECLAAVDKAPNFKSLKTARPDVIRTIFKNDWVREVLFKWKMKSVKWTYVKILELGKKYKGKNVTELKNEQGSALATLQFWRCVEDFKVSSGIIANQRPSGHWSKFENVEEAAKSCSSRQQFKKQHSGAYDSASDRGWLPRLLKHWTDNGTPHFKWTKPTAAKEAKKYKTRDAFAKGRRTAYQYAQRNGLLPEICAHMPDVPNRWTKPLATKEAKKYKTRGAFHKGSRGAYQYAYRHDLLDCLFPSMREAKEFMDL